jgi:hypothetical protein
MGRKCCSEKCQRWHTNMIFFHSIFWLIRVSVLRPSSTNLVLLRSNPQQQIKRSNTEIHRRYVIRGLWWPLQFDDVHLNVFSFGGAISKSSVRAISTAFTFIICVVGVVSPFLNIEQESRVMAAGVFQLH